MNDQSSSLFMRDPEAAIRQRRYMQAQALMQPQGPITSHTAGMAHLVNALSGALQEGAMRREARDAREENRADEARREAQIMGLVTGAPPAGPAPAPGAPDLLGGAPPASQAERASGGMLAPSGPARPAQVPSEMMPHFQSASQATGVPVPVLAAVAQQESGLGRDPRATANGGGPMQIVSGTAREPGFGMPPISNADRLNPETSIPWAARYLAARSPGTDWNNPDQRAEALRRYNGGGDPRYAQNVERHMPGAGAAARTGGVDMAGPGVPAGSAQAPSGDQRTPEQLRAAALQIAQLRGPGAAVQALMSRAESMERQAFQSEQRAAASAAASEERALRRMEREEDRSERRADRVGDNARADAGLELARQNAPVERLRQADGSEVILPRSEAVGAIVPPAPVDTFGRANTIRDEYRQLTGDFRTVQTAYQNIQSASKSNNGAGDMSMLYSYVKMLDPGSVVRESEFATAAASGSFGERIQGAVQRLVSGERLPDSLRQSFVAEARNLHATQRRNYDQVTTQYRGIAERNRLPVADVVTDFITPEAPTPEPPQAAAPAQRPGPAAPAIGEVVEGHRYKGGDPSKQSSWERTY